MRERFAFDEAEIPGALKSLRKSSDVGEAVILSTCNRVEVYAATALDPATAFAELKQFLIRWAEHAGTREDILECGSPLPLSHAVSEPEAQEHWSRSKPQGSLQLQRRDVSLPGNELYALAEPESLYHLFKVACGLDSMVLGETEILGQLKQAYGLASQHGHTGPRLNKAFQRAFHAAKHIRTHTNIQRGSISVAFAAVELAEKIFSSLNHRNVLVIGAGEMSEKTARALLSRGARNVVIAGRSFERAQMLANEFGGRAVPFDDWVAEFEKIDIAISSTSAPHHILDRARLEPLMKLRKQRPLLLIDIAVPRDIDPAVNFLENVYLYNIDDLQAIADDYLKQRKDEIARCDQIIAEKVKALLETKTVRPQINIDGHGLEVTPAKP
jgi:glutamyl-tRNA reductase